MDIARERAMRSANRVGLAVLLAAAAGCAEPEKETIIVYVPADAAAGDAGDGPDPEAGMEAPGPAVPASEIPYYQAWQSSAHADRTAPAFTNWNKDGKVPVTCARCHS